MGDTFLKNTDDGSKIKITSNEVAEKFDQKMKNIRLKDKEREAQAVAGDLGYQYIDLKGFPISPDTLILIPEETAKALKAICFFYGSNDIRIGSVDPNNPKLQALAKNLAKQNHANVQIYLISEASFDFALKLFRIIPKIRKFVSGVEITEADIRKYENEIRTFKDLDRQLKEVSITDMLTLIMAAAIKARSSDIHIEAEERGVKVRFRIDGILHDVAELDKKMWPQVVARVKLVAKLKINIEDRPQDGRFTIFFTDDKVDVRVSALPTAYGESVVMRLLMSSAAGLAFEDLGLRGKAFEALQEQVTKPNGMIVTTGPTGSGKTTTLYAVLNKLNDPGTKIITIEDPVEYKLEGINQSQVDHSKNYTFANGLRSILRQDPDIVMVGEVRDLETAEIAINAALTGHLVITTLHTNDAAGTIPRLLSMQVKPFLISPAINAMIGQRLVRKICEHCKQETELDNRTMSKVMKILSEIPETSGFKIPESELKKIKFYKGAGCEECQGLGYKGRLGIFEVMTMNKEVENLIITGHVSEYDMRSIAVKYGMITMVQDGLLKSIDGMTTVEEVFRVAKDISDRL
ncbi:MAG: GspE/PulE family protein [Patescibacteria group bacterium]|jgi:type II secretory ATPase GspE/PulE/Tfp pilus assembly ATPase PilB-like protein|nr:GspE/PulE family protein [Patescibacteria group bacterium]